MPSRRFFALALALAPASHAQTIVTGEGLPESGFSSLSRESDRVVQQFYDDDFFSAIGAPAEIVSMSFRLPSAADDDYPSLGDLNFGRYDITLAAASPDSALADGLTSAVFNDNMSGAMLVRSGSLTIPQGSFESNGAGEEAEFSFVIDFDVAYPFMPGQDLVMLVRHTGHGDVFGIETRWNFDGYEWANGTILSTGGVDDAVANFGPGDFNVANRTQFNFVPAPGGLGLLLAGSAVALRRRR